MRWRRTAGRAIWVQAQWAVLWIPMVYRLAVAARIRRQAVQQFAMDVDAQLCCCNCSTTSCSGELLSTAQLMVAEQATVADKRDACQSGQGAWLSSSHVLVCFLGKVRCINSSLPALACEHSALATARSNLRYPAPMPTAPYYMLNRCCR